MKIVRRNRGWRLSVTREGLWVALECLARRNGYRVGEICEELGCGERLLHGSFIRDIGLSPKTWLRQERMVVARHLLRSGYSPSSVARELSFSSLNNLRREFRVTYGISPKQYQERFLPWK